MTKKENEMQENKAIIDLTLEEALMGLSRTLYDRNVDVRVIMARQDLIGVITRKTQYLKDLLEILRKCEDDKHSLYCVYVLNALSSGKITQDDTIMVKEWLDNDK